MLCCKRKSHLLLTFFLGMQPRSLFRRFRLKLVTSSHACECGIAEVPKTANQVFGDSDAMAANYDAEEVRSEHPHRPQLIAQHGMALGTSTWAPCHRLPTGGAARA